MSMWDINKKDNSKAFTLNNHKEWVIVYWNSNWMLSVEHILGEKNRNNIFIT